MQGSDSIVCQQIAEQAVDSRGGEEGGGVLANLSGKQAMTMRQLMKSMPWIIMLMNLTSFGLALDAEEGEDQRSRSSSRRRWSRDLDPVGPSDALPH